MEKIDSYFLDTYSLLEIIKENKNFERFNQTLNFTSLMNLLELHYIIGRDFGVKKASEVVEKLKSIVVDITLEDIKKASEFRLKKGLKKFSYIDCLGYAVALNKGFRFLTGDKEFKDINNVEFVK